MTSSGLGLLSLFSGPQLSIEGLRYPDKGDEQDLYASAQLSLDVEVLQAVRLFALTGCFARVYLY